VAGLVDTSAWIEFFKPRGHENVKRVLRAALEEGRVLTTAPILTELLVGLNALRSADARAIARIRAIEAVELTWDVCERAGMLGRTLARRGLHVPTVDLMISAAAAIDGHEVWHVGDKHFAMIEQAGGPSQRDVSVANAT
jgi:hypothetical protein